MHLVEEIKSLFEKVPNDFEKIKELLCLRKLSKDELAELRITESDVYKVTYDEHNDEYGIISDEDVIGLGLYVPKRTDAIKFCGYSGNDKVEEEIFTLEECRIMVERGKFSYMTIETLHRGKVKDIIRLSY